ncbi:hypothetical protein D9O40_13185 [Clostridium autoethanogenum]|uniref:UvrD-like helicase ATP-binding domain-containing protein n=1 Tax=Clostridium autoethanogenum TaxID=84023 RepID=A0A3M0SJ32_9CLOT|nr:UvrD-helicase domain-containing protein [Clostridium autoethanogenum]RMC98528.1 hypothetical protein D9O40_13185 [Clostridium autoethanogenum]
MKIKYEEIREILFKNDFQGNSLVIDGISGSGKTTLAQEKYRHMIESQKIKSEEILIFVMNLNQIISWRRNISFNFCGQCKIKTYANFVKEEIIKYWPIIEKSCKLIGKSEIRPEFVNYDTSKYMMKMLIDYYRKRKGYFLDVTVESKKMAGIFVSNMSQAACSLIDMDKIGHRLYNSLKLKKNVNAQNFDKMDEVIMHYAKSFLNSGTIDIAMAIQLYNKYLLKDEGYLKKLRNIKYVLVDDMDEMCAAELNLVEVISKNAHRCYFFSNMEAGFCNSNGSDIDFIKKSKFFNGELINLEEHFLCSSEFCHILESPNKFKYSDNIYTDIGASLRSEMIEKIGDKLKELIDDGTSPEDIAIICPINDFVLSYELQSRFKDAPFEINNLGKKNKLMDNAYVHCIMMIICMCIEDIEYDFTMDDYRKFFSTLLVTDAKTSWILSNEVVNFRKLGDLTDTQKNIMGDERASKYNYIVNWIRNCSKNIRSDSIDMPELIRLIFLNIMIELPDSRENISICENLGELADRFINTLDKFKTIDNPSQKFVDFAINEAESFCSFRDIENMYFEKKGIILSSASNFLTSNIKSSVQIWTDVTSNLWSPRNIKKFSNDCVLKKSWNENVVYTEEIETRNRKKNLYSVAKALLRKCSGRIYLYGSEYSEMGYEQNGGYMDI